jgi:hypothetical protein
VQITEISYKYNLQGYPISKNDSEIYIYYWQKGPASNAV